MRHSGLSRRVQARPCRSVIRRCERCSTTLLEILTILFRSSDGKGTRLWVTTEAGEDRPGTQRSTHGARGGSSDGRAGAVAGSSAGAGARADCRGRTVYSTVVTIVFRLHAKGLLERVERNGRAFVKAGRRPPARVASQMRQLWRRAPNTGAVAEPVQCKGLSSRDEASRKRGRTRRRSPPRRTRGLADGPVGSTDDAGHRDGTAPAAVRSGGADWARSSTVA